MKIISETERLIIREILPSDIEGMFELHSDPDVHKFLGNQTITSKDQIINIINFVRKQYIDYGVGRWAVIGKKNLEFLGWTGLEFVTKETNNHNYYYDLGYRLIKRFWGKGFATESAFASLDYAFEKLNADKVYAMAHCDNEGSNKILKKVGLNRVETFYFEGLKHNWYNIYRTEYQKIKLNS